MNLRAMDAVFPIREKSVNRIESFNELSPKETDELERLMQFNLHVGFLNF